MAGMVSKGVSVKGAIAYQDDADPTQFHYFPAAPKLTLEDNLEAFSVKYWGIGERYYTEDAATGVITSLVGATMSGQVIFDLAGAQRDALSKQIAETYGIPKPKLIPMRLSNSKVEAVFASKTLGITADGESTFPTIAQIGSSVLYNVANGSGKFAQLFANVVAAGGEVGIANPDFGMNVYGDVELVADPWKVLIKANLKQVWEFVRARFEVSAQIGWFNLGSSSYESVMQDLQKSNIVTIKYIEGSADLKDPGNQLFEQGKLLFEAVNKEISAGEGLFKLEPNPEPPKAPPGGGTVLPWSFSVNGSYQKNFFKQDINWERELEYQGRILRRIPSSIVLAVSCGGAFSKFFFDLSDPSTPCITAAKIAGMQKRLKEEKAAQNAVVKGASKDLNEDRIGPKTYDQVMNYLQKNSLTEDEDSLGGNTARVGRDGRMSRARTYQFGGIGYQDILARTR